MQHESFKRGLSTKCVDFLFPCIPCLFVCYQMRKKIVEVERSSPSEALTSNLFLGQKLHSKSFSSD